MMHGHEKSGPPIVAVKPANDGGQPSKESGEPRGGAEGNAVERGTRRTPSRGSVSPGLDRVRRSGDFASPSNTRGGSRMREIRTYGSVRGARSNARPYRDRGCSRGPRLVPGTEGPVDRLGMALAAIRERPASAALQATNQQSHAGA